MLRRAGLLLLVAALGVAAPPVASAAETALRWRRVSTPIRGALLTAIAADPRSRRVALADEVGVLLQEPGRSFSRVARVERASDLHFDAAGDLWIASFTGLWRRGADGRVEERSPASDELGRSIHRIASAPGVWALATAGGVFASDDGRRWRPIGGALGSGEARAAAFRRGAGAPQLWLVAGPDLWRVEVERGDAGLRFDAVREPPIPGRPSAEEPVDLALDLPGAELAVLYPTYLARLPELANGSGGAGRSLAAAAGDRGWSVDPLPLPPGAQARRLAFAGGQFWIAHDRGLLQARDLAGPWRRAAEPVGRGPALDVVASDGVVLAATEGDLFEGRFEERAWPAAALPVAPESPAAGAGAAGEAQRRDPAIGEVHRAALRYVGLEPEHFRELRKHLRWRGWLPNVSLQLDAQDSRDYGWDYDESFVSGDTRYLHDRDRGTSRDLGGRVVLSWDLSDGAYDSNAVDLSREARQVIALRDDVLDELNQLYFERQRVLAALAARAGAGGGPEVAELRFRAQELAAGLDAWTGGWFSRAAASPGGSDSLPDTGERSGATHPGP